MKDTVKNAKCHGHDDLNKAGQILPRAFRRAPPTDTLISEFQPPELGRNMFLLAGCWWLMANASFLEGGDWEDGGLRPAQANSL
jgi:hypothetical protein